MLQYRDFLSLTDEEIAFIIKDIFETPRVDHIERDEKWDRISCDIYIMEDYPDYADSLNLFPNEITTGDFELTDKEQLKWQQYLLAKGCDYRLKDNPYMEQEKLEEKERAEYERLKAKFEPDYEEPDMNER